MLPWLTYPRTTHATVKAYAIFYPAIATAVLSALFLLSDCKVQIVGPNSVSSMIFGIFSLFPGFMIAALSVAASFGNPNVDKEIEDKTTKMPFVIDGSVEWDTPSKRQIAIYLFHFLLVNSIIIVLISGVGSFLLPNTYVNSEFEFSKHWHLFSFLVVSLFGSCVTLSSLLQGLTFFVERMMSNT